MARYKWSFDVSGVLTECKPIIDDGTSLDYGQQSGEVFYRAKLNGSLLFRFEFDYIMNAGYNAEHIVVLQRYDSGTDDFVEVWRGKFTLTDCTINYDTHTIEVTPETIDRYTAVLDNLEKEYNLVKLKAQLIPVNILVRPCIQIYRVGATKISNYIGGNGWESDCEAAEQLALENVFGFVRLRDCIWFSIDYNTGSYAGKNTMYYGRFLMTGQDEYIFPIDGRVYNSDGTYIDDNTLECRLYRDITLKWVFLIRDIATQTQVVRAWYNQYDSGDNYFSIEWASNIDNVLFNWDIIYGRTICQTELQSITISGTTYNLIDIPTEDIARNRNYNKILPYAAAEVVPDIDTSIEPTTWPQDIFGYYFEKPTNTPTRHHFTVNIEEWKGVSYWWYAGANAAIVETTLTSERTIKDCYDYRSVIQKLLGKAGVYPNYIISYCLGGTNDYVGTRTDLRITPRSNVISSYYDTPAQNAPITLAKVLNMLKTVYQCYWYIDNSGNFHIEHISFFDNGYSTTEDEPELIVDLESELHTRTLNNKVFGQNQVKFDKQDMPEQYTFGWADSVTRPFIGYPINCLDKYVQQGNISELNAADFDSDVDYVLSSPNDVSKDGFFLFALPAEGLDYSDTLKVENVTITDEIGDTFEVSIQNADAAFVKIHKTWWRYHLPCENININNEDTVALTTGCYKLQTLEFADTSMADIIGNVDNCNKIIRTQQGDGHIKTLSINLNSLATKADLLFNFVGRWYYLRGTALGASIEIIIDNEPITIEVSDNKWKLKYSEPLTALNFNAADVVSVNFADCDKLESVTSCNDMFKNCGELLAVDFGGKKLAAVTSAADMFAGCAQLTTLICPQTSTWKPDLSFADCPDLTTESIYSLLGFLYDYDSGVHTITPNGTMWNALTAEQQTDIMAKATAKGWQIGVPSQYALKGTSTASAVYATINGAPVEIEVVAGAFRYEYNLPITSISFENDGNVATIDFTESDLLAGITSLNDAFKGCAALQTVDFTGCDLSNVATAADCFSGCVALTSIVADSGVWQPDLNLSDSAMAYADMLSTIGILYTYVSGVHTITFNSTTWDSFTQTQQQTISDAASAKGWTTNAVDNYAYIRGTSTAATEQMTFSFIDLATQTANSETLNILVVNGEFEYAYDRTARAIYSLGIATFSNTLRTIEFTEDFAQCVQLRYAFQNKQITSASFPNATFENVTESYRMFYNCTSLVSVSMPSATFERLVNAGGMFENCTALPSVNLSHTNLQALKIVGDRMQNYYMFSGCTTLQGVDFGTNTFPNLEQAVCWFLNCTSLASVTWGSPKFDKLLTFDFAFAGCTSLVIAPNFSAATFENVQDLRGTFRATKIVTLNMPLATFASVTNYASGNYSPSHGTFYDCQQLTTINMPSATFVSVTYNQNMFYNNIALTTLIVPSSSTMPSTSASATQRNTDLHYSPLTYQSMLNVVNWLTDFTGYTAPTCTFKTSAWNALSSAEQATIQGILQAKNWNLATA